MVVSDMERSAWVCADVEDVVGPLVEAAVSATALLGGATASWARAVVRRQIEPKTEAAQRPRTVVARQRGRTNRDAIVFGMGGRLSDESVEGKQNMIIL